VSERPCLVQVDLLQGYLAHKCFGRLGDKKIMEEKKRSDEASKMVTLHPTPYTLKPNP